MLTRDQILAARQLPRETVAVPEWGGDVIVSVMSGTDRDAWEGEIARGGKEDFFRNARARLAARCVIDEAGSKLFTDADVDQLGALNWIALERVTKAAQRLNKLTDAEMEDIKGNS